MLKNVSPARLMGAWFGSFAALAAGALAAGVTLTMANALLWSVLCLVPPAVMMYVWRAGAQPVTMTQLLFSADSSAKDGRP
jgi:hypothetical protein